MLVRTMIALVACTVALPSVYAQQAESTRRSTVARFSGEVRSITTTLAVQGADVRLMFVDSMKVMRDSTGARYDDMYVDSTRSRVGITNAEGAFTIRGVEPGHYMLNVRRIGFQPFEGLLTIDTATVEMELALTQVSAVLPRITISASATNKVTERLDRNGFTTRYRLGTSGKFIDRKEILRRKPTYITDVLAAYGVHSGNVVIDRVPADWELLKSYPVDLIIGMEIYPRRSALPIEFNMTKMGSSALSSGGQATLMEATVVIWTYVL